MITCPGLARGLTVGKADYVIKFNIMTSDGEAHRPVGSVGFTPFPKHVTRFHMLMLLWLVVLSRQTLILGSSTPVGPSMISLLAC